MQNPSPPLLLFFFFHRRQLGGDLQCKLQAVMTKCIHTIINVAWSIGSAYSVTYSQTLVINVSCISTGPIINSNRDAHSDARDYSRAWLHVPKIHVPISTPYLRLVCLMYACPLGCSAFYHILVPCSLLLSFKKKSTLFIANRKA